MSLISRCSSQDSSLLKLSERLTTKKSPTAVSPGDGIGVHPARLWCENSHPDSNKVSPQNYFPLINDSLHIICKNIQ